MKRYSPKNRAQFQLAGRTLSSSHIMSGYHLNLCLRCRKSNQKALVYTEHVRPKCYEISFVNACALAEMHHSYLAGVNQYVFGFTSDKMQRVISVLRNKYGLDIKTYPKRAGVRDVTRYVLRTAINRVEVPYGV